MLKRLIGVVPVINGMAVQSFGFSRYLPIGNPLTVVENLDRWQVDEILLLCLDRSSKNLGPAFDLVESMSSLKLVTPLTYMGGIRDADDAAKIISFGADRIAIETLFFDAPREACLIAERIGKQAVIRGLSLIYDSQDNEIKRFDAKNRSVEKISDDLYQSEMQQHFSEILVLDAKNDGGVDSFDQRLVDKLSQSFSQLICFGGVSSNKQVKCLLQHSCVSAVAVGNVLSHSELAHARLLGVKNIENTRVTSHGNRSRGARQW
jgi:cyclase